MTSVLPATLAALAAALAMHAAGAEPSSETAPRRGASAELRFIKGPSRLSREEAAAGAAAAATLMRAWEALRRGELAIAREAYTQVLRDDGRNLGALRGLAAIALRRGQPEEARRLFSRIRELAPQDAEAAMALASAESAGENPVAEESHLKTLAAAAEAASAVQAALGRLYARQQRWKEAEQAWFAAVADDPAQPDHHYNLAVCLDRLGQSQLAARYYRSALARAADQASAFDAALARARLAELEPR